MSGPTTVATIGGMKKAFVIAVAAAVLLGTAGSATAAVDGRHRCGPVAHPGAFTAALSGYSEEATAALVRYTSTNGCWRGSVGVADVRSGRPVPSDARFRIGSMTKTFTTAAVLRLAAEGKVDLDRTVQHYLPGLLPASYQPVTVRQTLNYTHGLRGVDVPHKSPDWFLAHRFDTWAPGSQLGLDSEPFFAPGTQQKYDNAGHIVAGLIIEKVTGRPYAETVERTVLRPLGLRDTYLPGASTRIRGPHNRGYELIGGEYIDVTEANPTLQWSAAEMISTAADLERFLTALVGGRLLPAEQQAELFAVPRVRTYDGDDDPATGPWAIHGAGITRLELGALVVWSKSGDRPGYTSAMAVTPDLSVRLVYSVNTFRMGGDMPAVATRIVGAALAQ